MTDEASIISRGNNRRFRYKVSKQWVVLSGDCSPFMHYLASKSYKSCYAPVKFLDALLRGYGQVVFANNPISGLIIFFALIVAAPEVSGAGLLTASVGLLTSIVVLPQTEDAIINGLTVFNPLLIGLVTASVLPQQYGIHLEYWHYFFMILASIISVYVTSAFGSLFGALGHYPLPYLTMPFNIVQQLLFLILISSSTLTATPPVVNVTSQHVDSVPIQRYLDIELSTRAIPSGAYMAPATRHISSQEDVTFANYKYDFKVNGTMDPNAARIERNADGLLLNTSRENDEEVTWSGVFSGIVLSTAQVYTLNYAPTAVLIYIAILIYSPITAAFALLGAAIGTLTGVFLTDTATFAAPGGVYDGTWGFNGLLCTTCLGGLFFVLSWSSVLAAIFCAVFGAVLQYVFIPPFAQADLIPMTLPFNLSALLFLCVTTSRVLVRPQKISFPEKHRLEYKQQKLAQDQRNSASGEINKDAENEKTAEVV